MSATRPTPSEDPGEPEAEFQSSWREPPPTPQIPESLRRPIPQPSSLRPVSPSAATQQAQQMGWVYATSMTFVGAVAVFTVLGYLGDKWLGTGPWLLVIGLVIGIVGGTFKFIRDGLAANRSSVAAAKARHPQWRSVEPETDESETGESDDPR